MIKFLANENVPFATVRELRNNGFDVFSISENFPSIKDEAVVLFASAENRVIITFDRDYGELVFKKRLNFTAGVIYFRIQSFLPEKPAEILLRLISTGNIRFEGYFTVIGENHIRQRKI